MFYILQTKKLTHVFQYHTIKFLYNNDPNKQILVYNEDTTRMVSFVFSRKIHFSNDIPIFISATTFQKTRVVIGKNDKGVWSSVSLLC